MERWRTRSTTSKAASAFLFAHRVAEQPAEQADVVAHRAVGFVVDEVQGGARDRVGP